MRNESRFIPGEEIGAVEQWSFDAVDTASLLLAAQVRAREKASVQSSKDALLKQEGYAQGFAQGQAQGALQAQQQIADFIARQGEDAAREFAKLFASAQAQLNAAEEVIAQGTLELGCEVARQVLRHELSVNPAVLLPVVREGIDSLLAENKSTLVRLNPLDLEAIGQAAFAECSGRSIILLADAALTRGGCLVESAGTLVDGTIERRWARAIANLGLHCPWDTPHDKP
jgi:flagellar assembly protein FliH